MKKCTFKEKQLAWHNIIEQKDEHVYFSFFPLDLKLSSNVHESRDHKKDVVQSYLSAFL